MSGLQLLEPVAREEPPPRRGRLTILVAALVVLIAIVCWATLHLMQGSRSEARTEAALGQSAHAAGDCAAAVPHLKRALNLGTIEFLDPPVDGAGLRAEIAACEHLERARHAAAGGLFAQAAESFGAYLGTGVARYAAAIDEQSGARIAYGRALEERDLDTRAITQYAAVLADAPDTRPAERAEKRLWALFERDVEAVRRDRPCAALDSARVWTRQQGRTLRAVRNAAHHALSWSLLRCGQDRIDRGERAARDARFATELFTAAEEALTQAVRNYPDTKPGRHALAELERFSTTRSQAQFLAAQVAHERLRSAKIRKEVSAALGHGRSLPGPQRTGSAGSKLTWTIRNATGGPLYVAWTGKEPGSVNIGAGAKRCGKAPVVTVTTPPGVIGIAVLSDDGWSAGKWTFASDAYRSCVR